MAEATIEERLATFAERPIPLEQLELQRPFSDRVIKPLLSTAVAEASVGKDAATLIPESDAEIAALGRSVSARYVNDE